MERENKKYSVLYLFLYIDIKIHRKKFEKTVNQIINRDYLHGEEKIWSIKCFSRMHLHIICVFGTKFFTEQLVPGLRKKMYKISLEHPDI